MFPCTKVCFHTLKTGPGSFHGLLDSRIKRRKQGSWFLIQALIQESRTPDSCIKTLDSWIKQWCKPMILESSWFFCMILESSCTILESSFYDSWIIVVIHESSSIFLESNSRCFLIQVSISANFRGNKNMIQESANVDSWNIKSLTLRNISPEFR